MRWRWLASSSNGWWSHLWWASARSAGLPHFTRSMPQPPQVRHRQALLRRRRQLHLLRVVITFSINKEEITLAPAALRRHLSAGPAFPKSAASQYPTLMGMRHEDGREKVGVPCPMQIVEVK